LAKKLASLIPPPPVLERKTRDTTTFRGSSSNNINEEGARPGPPSEQFSPPQNGLVDDLGRALNFQEEFFREGVKVPFVEQYAVIFGSKFLRWLLRKTDALIDLQMLYGSDWGMDDLWCAAAADYSNSRSLSPTRLSSSSSGKQAFAGKAAAANRYSSTGTTTSTSSIMKNNKPSKEEGCLLVQIPLWHTNTRTFSGKVFMKQRRAALPEGSSRATIRRTRNRNRNRIRGTREPKKKSFSLEDLLLATRCALHHAPYENLARFSLLHSEKNQFDIIPRED